MAGRKDGDRPYQVYSDRGIATLNTRIAGRRLRPSLGIPYDPATASRADVRAVEKAAAEKYAQLVAGRVLEVKPGARILTSMTLFELGGLWLVEAGKLWPKGVGTRVIQLRNVTTWAEEAPRFAADHRTPLQRIADDSGPAQYAADRLAAVLKDTIEKEISNLFAFLDWAVREKHLASAPPRPTLPRSAVGTRSGTQREEPVDITDEEALAICAELPEWTVRGGRGIVPGQPLPPKAIRVRDVFRFSYEQALRPGDAQQLRLGRHWNRGQRHLFFTPDMQKSGFKGRIPLTDVALEILERCAPESGLIFGKHDLRGPIKAAAAKVLSPEKARDFAPYDFRHARAVHALETTGDLLGTQRLLRHTRATTTNRYLRTRESHVESVVDALNVVRSRSGATGGGSVCYQQETADCSNSLVYLVRRRGLEPLRCYPLAPQETESECCRDGSSVERCQPTPVNVGDLDDDASAWSGVGQERRPLAKTASGFRSVRLEVDGEVVARVDGAAEEPIANVETRLRLAAGHRGVGS